jgi:hypothetical protein
MLRLNSMAMQQTSKGASGSGPNPALSDEQADQFAASFTPAWDAEDALGDTTEGGADATLANTTVMDGSPLGPTPDAPPIVGTSTVILTSKHQTMIGVPPPATLPEPVRSALSSAEAIEPENVLEVRTAPPAQAAPAMNHGMRTVVMDNRPAPSRPPPPGPGPQPGARSGMAPSNAPRVAIAADPFQGRPRVGSSSDDLDLVPKRSSKTIFFVVGGLAFAAGLALFLRFALTDDAPKATPSELATGPAATTADIPPPPPKVETPPPPATTTAAVVAKAAEPPPPPLAVPPRAAEPVPQPRVAAAPAAPRQPARGALLPPPQAAAAPPSPPASPKTPPKAPNGGIVRDNPF